MTVRRLISELIEQTAFWAGMLIVLVVRPDPAGFSLTMVLALAAGFVAVSIATAALEHRLPFRKRRGDRGDRYSFRATLVMASAGLATGFALAVLALWLHLVGTDGPPAPDPRVHNFALSMAMLWIVGMVMTLVRYYIASARSSLLDRRQDEPEVTPDLDELQRFRWPGGRTQP
jgi:putative flippase GtrA